ncbi:acetyl-CoA synthetase-like protein [Xylaria sp. CBS 124048]|nr:acetyl-CoA synthetase-like protein [Xylaria sp. CBS 124048]
MAHLGLDDAILAQICEQCHISSQDIEDVYACTPLQSGMLVDSALYTHAAIHSLDSSIDLDRLCSALHQVIALNSALRTRIVDCDAVHHSSETDLEKFLEQDRSVSMNLGTPLARVTILNRKKLVTTYHHTIFDYRVLEFLFQDTWSIYQGMSPEAHTPFKKFVEYCHGINEKAAIAFWKGRFKSGTSTTFPSIPPEHSVLATLRATREILLTKAPPSALMPAYVEAAWALTASDYSSSDSIVFGSVLSGRLAGSSGAETAFGPTIATVPMQIDLKPNMTIQHVLKSRVESRRTLSTSPYLQYGLPKIRNVSNEARIASGFQTVLNILHKPASVNTPGFTLEGENETRHAYALVLTCTLGEKHVKVKAVFDGAVLPEGPMRRVLRQFEHRLKQLVSSSSSTPLKRLQCLNFGDTLEIMDWNGDVSKPIEKCLHELVASRAYEYPDDPAVKSWDGEATYGELSVMVDNLAQKLLKGRTFAAESPVCCILERSLSLVVAALAIMKVGGTCVPIDMSLPKARKEAIVRISGARLILTSPNYGEELETSCDMHTIALNREPVAVTSALLTNVKPHQAAYILYTSGSTGQPKGVVLEHRSLASSFTELEKAWGWTRGTRVLQFSAPAWDACALETIGTLLKGGCVCIPSAIERESGLGEYIKSAGVNFAIQTPTALRNLRPEEVLPGLQTLVSAGEPMPRQVFDTWSSKTSVCAATAELAPTCSYPDTIGNPDTSRLLPIGAVGEMLVDGPGVARGYYAEPAKTEAAFIKLPSFVPGQGVNPPRVYYGTISFIGRQDNQVKIRGQRFELGEVEEVLLNRQRNCQVVATTHQAPDSFNKDLVAIITFGSGSEQFRNSHDSESELREISLDEDGRRQLEDIQNHAKASFPPYMIPTVWFVVASLPLTTSMKIDRKKIKTWLDKVNISASRNTLGRMPRTLTQPETPAEVALQLAWSSVLDIEQTKIGRESSFVRLGGDSITAMQVATRCRKQNLHITVAALLRKDTLAESAVEAKVTQEAPPVLTMDTVEEIRYRPLSPIQTFLAENEENVESMYPCTGVQEGILFAQLKSDSKENEYHDRFASKLSSRVGEEIKFDQIINAWRAVCQAHPILRTIFTSGLSDQGAFQQIVLRHHDPSVSVIARQKRPSLDLAKPPHHLTLYRESASVGYAVLEISHTILDARTFQLIWSQIAQGYSLNYSGIAQGNNFSDYVSWLQAQENEGWQYWREYMAGVEPCLFPRDPSALPLASNRWTRGPEVPFTDARRLNRFCQNQGVTVAMFMQAAWGAVLQLYTGMSIVCLGSLRSDQDAFPGAADILGPLVSMLPCKFSFNMETTAHSLLETAREDASNSMRHSGCSLARLHDDLGLAGSPLFDTAMTIQRSWPSNLGDDYLVVEAVEAEDPTEYSILIGVQYSHEKLLVRMAHHRSRLSDSFMEQVSNTFARVIDTMVSTPQQPLSHILDPVLSPKSSSGGPIHPLAVGTEEFRLLKRWNAKIPVAVETCIPDIFRAVAQSQPTAPAVCSWDGNLDYGKLDALSDCLAYQLRVDHGVGTGTIVAFACEKAASAVVIVLAISKAGAAFLPLDNSHPPERLRTVLADADVRLVLVNAPDLMDKMTACFPDGSVALVDLAELEQYTARKVTQLPEELAHCTVEPQHAGYIVYTSGSTGKPKGILLEHRNIATSAEHHIKRLGMTTQSRILQLSNFVFDVGLLDMIYAFFAGACVCMPSEAERMNDIAGAIRRMGANFVMCTPTYATLFNPQETPTLKTVVLAGEPVKQENVDTWAPHVRLINAYGPAETAVSSCQDIAVGKISQDIGNPSCCRYWIVNPENHDELCPLEVAGELIIEGPLVARGYVNNPQATAAAFISAPAWTRNIEFAGLGLGQHRFYKTGDLVTRVGETSIIYQGRKDTQVKIRGMRIELAEIENHLNREANEDARWAVELIKPRNGEEACLAAFFHLKDSAGDSSGHGLLEPAPETALAARKVLQREVPAYMVPDYYIRLQKLPTNSSMKTDRKTLRTIGAELPQAKLMGYRTVEDSSLPDGLQRSTAESEDDLAGTSALMQEAWAGVLNIPAPSIRLGSHFFSLGGNSIRAMRLVGKLRASGYLLAVSDVFKSPTLTGMVHSISHLPGQKSKPNGVATHKHSIGIAPAEFQHFCALAKTRTWLSAGNIESAAPATDVQAWMLSVDQVSDSGWEAVVCLEPFPGQSLDLLRLRRACQQVVRNHAILRTIFIQDGSRLLQVALRSPPIEQVHVYSSSPGNIEPQVSVSSDMLQILPRFHLTSDGSSSCLRIDIEIHHAHYDAISFSHLLHDLNEAYAGRTISVRRPSFHEWISHATSEELASSQEFWRRVLKGSISCPLMPSIKWPVSGGQVNSQARTTVPLANLNAPHGTPATILKAAWACVLSQILEREDIIFGYVSANRFSNRLPDVEQVPGPCINLLPLRAFPESQKTIAVLVTELQQQLSDSLPHHQMGFRSIVKNCTRWPTSRFNSIVLFQNHESLGTAVKLGDVECMSTGRGQACDSADIWIVAAPESDQSLGIEIGYSTVNIPIEFAQWTLFYLESLLRALPANWERAVGDLNREVLDCNVDVTPLNKCTQYEVLMV